MIKSTFPPMRLLSFLFLLLCAQPVSAQTAQPEQERTELNQTDSKGLRQGMWLHRMPARMGEPAYLEFGYYSNGEKTGTWYRFDANGVPEAIEQYSRNVLNGEVKYFDDGRLTVVGHYRGLNPEYTVDTIVVEDPVTGAERLVPVSSERGTIRHGLWRFYDPMTGRLLREDFYQLDEKVSGKTFGLSQSDSAYYKQRDAILPHNRSDQPLKYQKGRQFNPYGK